MPAWSRYIPTKDSRYTVMNPDTFPLFEVIHVRQHTLNTCTCICINRAVDQRICFFATYIPLPPKSEISSLQPPHHAFMQLGLCLTWSKTPKTGFLMKRLNSRQPDRQREREREERREEKLMIDDRSNHFNSL